MLVNLVVFIVVLGIVLLVHELGHFFMARRFGIVVQEFGIGYPPRIKTLAVRNGVEYTLNALPFGAFVRMLGEEDPSAPGSFASKSAAARIATLLAGAVGNLLLSILIFALILMIGEQRIVGSVIIHGVAPNSPAQRADMRVGDVITSFQGESIENITELVERTRLHLDDQVSLGLKRDSEQLTVIVVPRSQPPPGEGAMGISIGMKEGYDIQTVHQPIWRAIPLGIRRAWMTAALTVTGLMDAARSGFSSGDIAGPVGIMELGGAVARTGLVNLLNFVACFSVNLFIVNLLPLPALDGGRIAFILLEMLRGGKRIAPEREGLVHVIGILLFIGLSLVLSYYDIVRILSGRSLLP
jgi:regulator of sigma E protease